jgi:hypothetical protein
MARNKNISRIITVWYGDHRRRGVERCRQILRGMDRRIDVAAEEFLLECVREDAASTNLRQRRRSIDIASGAYDMHFAGNAGEHCVQPANGEVRLRQCERTASRPEMDRPFRVKATRYHARVACAGRPQRARWSIELTSRIT